MSPALKTMNEVINFLIHEGCDTVSKRKIINSGELFVVTFLDGVSLCSK